MWTAKGAAAFTVALIGALLGFLRSNFYPASIYLGDCGSLFIGLTLGALAMVMSYTQHNPLGWLAPLYILAVPIIASIRDVGVYIWAKLLDREPFPGEVAEMPAEP